MYYCEEIESEMVKFYISLSEKDKRRYAAIEAKKMGHGGIKYISELFGCHRNTITEGKNEIENMNPQKLLNYLLQNLETSQNILILWDIFKIYWIIPLL